MSVGLTESPPAAESFFCRRFETLDDIADLWDSLVPEDRPDLQPGFLLASVEGGVVTDPNYLMVFRDDTPLALAFVYTLDPDVLGVIPVWIRQILRFLIPAVRRGWRPSMRVCGPPVWNGASGVCMAHGLDTAEKKAVLRVIEQEVAASARKDQFVFFREYNEDQEQAYACELERLGYFRAELLPGMQLRTEWTDLDDYLRTLRSSYRRHFRRDLRAGDQLSWEWCESFDDLADVSAELFDNVHFKAEFRFERLTPEFFRKVSAFGPARLLVAREPDSGKVLGINLLLFTNDYIQFVYLGMDYDHIEPYRLYFNLFERSLIAALEHGASRCTLGSDSYTFKSRLGAEPYRLIGYFWHRKRWVRFVLRTLWQWMFDDMQVMNRRVFSDDAGAREKERKDQTA